MASFQLFGTDGCHLCEEAQALIMASGLAVTLIDIAEQEQYQALYAWRIPVLRHVSSGQELGWPFDAEQLAAFIAASCC